jgi:hypothetical protein
MQVAIMAGSYSTHVHYTHVLYTDDVECCVGFKWGNIKDPAP